MHSAFYLFLSLLLFTSCKKDGNNPGEVLPALSVSNLSIVESNDTKPVYIDLRLSVPYSKEVSMILNTEDGTAKAGEDYLPLNNLAVVFEPGDVQQSVKIDILGDEDFEEIESFFIKISEIENALEPGTEIEITIENDDINTTFEIPTTGFVSPTSYAGYNMIWSTEFDNGTNLSNNWTFEIGNGNSGWGNNELQYYREENTSIKDGFLVIEARKEPFAGRNYTSSRLISKGKFEFKYGRVDIRAALPKGQGIWPALWLLGSNISQVSWPACGEIDIMEMLGHEPNKVYGTVHWSNNGQHAEYGGSRTKNSGDFVESFHVFSILWDESKITWLVDNLPYHTIDLNGPDKAAFKEDFFFILNVAVGGNWPGNPDSRTSFPQRMFVDYIRVFQQ
jgi:hypothetical protein